MRKSLPITVLAILLLAILVVSSYTRPRHQGSKDEVNQAQTADPPVGLSRLVAWPEGVTVLALVLTLFFIAWQAMLTRQAILSSEESSKIELRAYIVVVLNSGSYQDHDNEIKFEGSPAIQNTGKTPAHNVKYRTNSAVIKEPLAPRYNFAPGQDAAGEYVLGMNQNYVLHIVAQDFVDPKDVTDIMEGKGRAFYYWGVIDYDDVFGESHFTEFCHRIFFYPDTEKPGQFRVNGTYIAGKNNAT